MRALPALLVAILWASVCHASPLPLAFADGRNAVASEVTLASASTVDLGSASSGYVYVTGTTPITGFGSSAAVGSIKRLRFAGATTLTASSSLILPNNGASLLVQAGDTLEARYQGSSVWRVTSWQPAAVFSLLDERAHAGALAYRLAVGADANTDWPDFAVDGGASQTKTLMKSAIFYDPGDTVDIAVKGANKVAGVPTAWTVPCLAGFMYGWFLDSNGQFIPDKTLAGVPNNSTYVGRGSQISFGNSETPTPIARGGSIVLSVTRNGTLNPVDRYWINGAGVGPVLPGLAVLETSGVSLPYTYGGSCKNIWAPSALNWADVGGWGNLSLVASDEGNGALAGIIAIRKQADLTAGWDWTFNVSADELRLATVSASTRTDRLAVSNTGDLTPATSGGVSAGTTTKPFANVVGQTLYETTSHTPATSSEACAAGKLAWDASYVYVCTATNTWKRAALGAF